MAEPMDRWIARGYVYVSELVVQLKPEDEGPALARLCEAQIEFRPLEPPPSATVRVGDELWDLQPAAEVQRRARACRSVSDLARVLAFGNRGILAAVLTYPRQNYLGQARERGVDVVELVDAGEKALLRAVETYRESGGAKFTRYASRVVERALWPVLGKKRVPGAPLGVMEEELPERPDELAEAPGGELLDSAQRGAVLNTLRILPGPYGGALRALYGLAVDPSNGWLVDLHAGELRRLQAQGLLRIM